MIQRYPAIMDLQGDFVSSLRECYNHDALSAQIAAIKQVLSRHREKIRALIRNGATGTETTRLISEMVDTLIRVMWDHVEMSVPQEENLVALVAVGGYGRMELCPQSDVDLLVLTSPSPTPAEAEQAERIVRNLWDYGFQVGSSVRSLAQCESASTREPETWTSFLTERFLAGNHDLYRKFVRLMQKPLYPWRTSSLIESKLRERERRKGQLGFLVQHLEPNLKEGIGCLRDVHSMMWIAKVKHDCDDFQDLVREGLLSPQEVEDINGGYDFLLQVRCCLHFLTQSKDDHLGFHIQPQIAEDLGFQEKDGQKPVELFLRAFYHHTKAINRLTDSVIQRWLKPRGKGRGESLADYPQFRLADDALDLKTRVGNPFIGNVGLMLQFFELAQTRGLNISNHAFIRLTQAVSILSTADYQPREHLGDFLRLCQGQERVGRILRSMNDVKLLGLLVSDFNLIYCHSQHDIYHIYTTDEHTITVVRQLAYLPGRAEPELQSLREALAKVNDREVLILACFYHDIGKGLGANHSVSGARLVFEYMERMGFSPSRCKEASNLVLYHLLMNEVIQRRDLDDPKTIRDFIAKVDSPAFLHKLYVLTYCDVSSVHPDAWSSWKASLLKKLYDAALAEMRRPFQAQHEAKDMEEALVENVSRHLSPGEVRHHLELLPRQYASATSPEEVVSHIRLAQSLSEQGFNVRVVQRETHWEITVAARDHEALLSGIAGAMAHLELSILSARIFTRGDGIALDKFMVSAPPADRHTPDTLRERLLKELDRHFRLSLDELRDLQERSRAQPSASRRRELPFAASIAFSNAVSESFSTIDLTCKDQIGLLFQVTRTLSLFGLNVHGAVLTTEADKAMDAFYVTDAKDRKISEPRLISAIIETLRLELSTGNEKKPAAQG